MNIGNRSEWLVRCEVVSKNAKGYIYYSSIPYAALVHLIRTYESPFIIFTITCSVFTIRLT